MIRRGAIVVLVALGSAAVPAGAGEVFDAATVAFAEKVDTSRLSLLGVQAAGRVAILDTVAREQLRQMYGSADVQSRPPAFAWLELYFNAGLYVDRPIIHVGEKNMRAFIQRHLAGAEAEAFQDTRRLPPASLLDEEAWPILMRQGRADRADYTRAARIPSLRDALFALSERKEFRVPMDRLSVRYSGFLGDGAPRVAPAPGGQWLAIDDAFQIASAHSQPAAGGGTVAPLWADLRDAWRARNAQAVNDLIARLDQALPDAAGASYPSPRLRKLELLYNRTNQATVVWVGFALSLLLFIVAAASDRRWARRAGLGVFATCTAVLLAGFVIRWLLSGRAWYLPPIMNQFEAVVGSALLAALVSIGLEMAWRKNYFALAASLYATVALLCGFFLPERMGAGISAQHGILASPVMAVHVAVIIVGHALAGMTFFLSLAYMVAAALAARSTGLASSPPDLRRAGELSAPAVIDRCNLIVAQLACWTVVLGTILGAYWGDFAWGRWWGWDPKETWALITCLVYVGVVHMRFATPPKWRGLVTALACILGAAVMLFNWIAVNYLLAGKHSYA